MLHNYCVSHNSKVQVASSLTGQLVMRRHHLSFAHRAWAQEISIWNCKHEIPKIKLACITSDIKHCSTPQGPQPFRTSALAVRWPLVAGASIPVEAIMLSRNGQDVKTKRRQRTNCLGLKQLMPMPRKLLFKRAFLQNHFAQQPGT